jgi:dienelactone hydrolase
MTDTIPGDIRPSFPVKTPRDRVRSRFQELLGLDEIPSQVDFDLGESREGDGLLLTEVKYANYMGETISATIARPLELAGETLAGVVGMPGTGSSSEEVLDPRLYRPKPEHEHGPLFGWGRALARQGYAVLSFSPKGTAVRRRTIDEWEVETKLLAPYARPQLGILADETVRASLVLGSLDGVDPARVGLTGMSLGGLASWLAMSMAPWIRTSAAVCGVLGTMEQMIHHGQIERHSSAIFIPHMLRYFDHPEVVAACIAPRPFMMVAPTEDDDMPREGVDELIRVVEPVYEAAGHPEFFRVHRPPGIHTYRLEYFQWVVEWFEEYLKPL